MSQLRAITEADWRELRNLRLQALADTPHAFAETLFHAVEQDEDHWRARAAWNEQPGHCGFAAVTDGRWVGMMRMQLDEDGSAVLLSVFVAPHLRWRPHGVADLLLDPIEAAARNVGAVGMRLSVHEDNLPAQRFYQRRGYAFTGVRRPYEPNPSEDELEMRRPLDHSSSSANAGAGRLAT